jgi:hypothetical protein
LQAKKGKMPAPLGRTDAGIVDYSVEATELIDLIGNSSCSSDRGEVPGRVTPWD